MSPMRVLHIGKFYPPHLGGMESHLETLCGELKRHADVQVIVANDYCHHARSTVDGVTVCRMAKMFTVASTPVCVGMMRAIRRAKPHIVHLHTPNPLGALAYLLSGQRVPLVMTWHSDVLRQRLLMKAFSPIQGAVLKLARAIVTSSEKYLKTSLQLAAYREKCQVIPFGIRLERFSRPDEACAREIRQRYGPRIVLTVGRMVYYKGFQYLIRAMRKVDATLLIIGDGPLRPILRQQADDLGVMPRVKFLGSLAGEITSYYHASDVFVLPSIARTEAFGLVQIEAMASGLPVVNTALDTGVPTVSLNGVTGITVPPARPEALSTAINQLLQDRRLRSQYGNRARQRASEEFGAPAMGRTILELYRQVLARSGNHAPFATGDPFEHSMRNGTVA